MDIRTDEFNERLEKLAREYSHDRHFKVIIQPALKQFSIAEFKRIYLANVSTSFQIHSLV